MSSTKTQKTPTPWEEMTPEQQKALYDELNISHQESLEKLAKAENDLAEATEFNSELQAQLEKAQLEKGSEFPIVKNGDDIYHVIIPQFTYKNQVIKATELEDDSELLKELIELGFGGLVAMPGKEEE